MVANQLSTRPTDSSSITKRTFAAQYTGSVRSTTPPSFRPMSLLPPPEGLPADPLGSRSYLRGLVRRPGPAPPPQHPAAVPMTATPGPRRSEKKKKTKREVFQKGANSSQKSVDILDRVPIELARAVVNMQQYYASGADELADKLGSVEEELRRAKEENVRMKERLDMHFGMLGQAAEFMQKVSEALGMAMPVDVDEEMVARIEGGEGLDRGFADDGDLAMTGVDMEVPPVPVDDGLPMRSTGRMASCRRRMVQEKESREFEDEGNADDGDEDARILQGAPRLQDVIRQDAMRRNAARQDVIRQSRFTPINRVPSRQSTPSVDDNSDSDEYRPSSPSEASSSESPTPSLYEEEIITPSSTITVAKPSPPQNIHLQTPPPAPAAASASSPPPSKPRYSVKRCTTIARYASGPPGKPYRFHRMGRTVLDVWMEYKCGSDGNPAIEALERQYGTEWRTGKDTRELKYASNYVSMRQKVVSQVEEMCEREGIGAMEACRRLDERVDGRMQLLISAARKGQDPFVVIPKR